MKKKYFGIAIIFIFFILAAWFMENEDEDFLSKNIISRNEPGDGDKENSLSLNARGVFEDYNYELQLPERKYSAAEIQELFKIAKKEIAESFSGGQDVNHITEDLSLEESYAEGHVEADWYFDNDEIIDAEGKLSGKQSDDGTIIRASVLLSCQEEEEIYQFSFIVFQPELSKQEKILRSVNEDIQKQLETDGLDSITLPEEAEGVELEWKGKKDKTILKVILLEVIIAILLFLSKKERIKNEKEKRMKLLALDYPEIVSKMSILLGAGMTIEQSWNRISAQYLNNRNKNSKTKRPAYEEMIITQREIADGESTQKAYQRFAERTGLSCYQRFARVIMQSMTKGNKGLCQMLEKESDNAFNERKHIAKKMGEEASTKMLMPLLLALGVVIAIVIVPAILNFNV